MDSDDGGTASGERGVVSREHLATVSYFPGVTPPSSETEPVTAQVDAAQADAAQVDAAQADAAQADAVPLPDFVSFFGADSTAAEQAPLPENAPENLPENIREEQQQNRSAKADRREVRAENVSMHALTRKGLSRWELEKTLLARELDGEIVEAELDRLESVGLLDDAALAETLVRTQHERKGLGRGALTAELRRRHIDQQHIDAALEQVDDDDEQSRATELAVKRAGQLSSYDVETAKRRLTGFLMRRGYSSSVVRIAIDTALSARSGGVRFR